ncbi:MAG: DnaB-like helicase C-terminal domain-containing protein [Coprobacillus sp.]
MDNIKKYENYQSELIGILATTPNYFKKTILRKEHFDKEHGLIFEVMENSFKDKGVILHELIFSDKRINTELYINCTTNVIHKYEDYFDALEIYAVDQYKKQEIFNNAMKLNNGTIDINDFQNLYENVNSIGVAKGNKLSEKTILDNLCKKVGNIQFSKFRNLADKLLLVEKDYLVVAGKPGAGKTAFALNILCDLSVNYPCLYFNMEMSEQALIQRLAAMTSNLNFSTVKNFSTLPQNAVEAIKSNARSLGNRDIEIISESQSLDAIRRYVQSYQNHGKHFIVIVDHMGLVRARGKGSYEVATAVAKGLRRISLDNNCTMIALCQLSRESEKAKKPTLSMLRDSGEIEQSARKVLFVWESNGRSVLHIEKNDSGALATIPVEFKKEKQIFYEIEPIRE